MTLGHGAADAVARDALARGAASGTLVAARLRVSEGDAVVCVEINQ